MFMMINKRVLIRPRIKRLMCTCTNTGNNRFKFYPSYFLLGGVLAGTSLITAILITHPK